MAINSENHTVDFPVFSNEKEKENFVKYLIHKQLNLGKFMAMI